MASRKLHFHFSGGFRRRCPEVGIEDITIDLAEARFWTIWESPKDPSRRSANIWQWATSVDWWPEMQ